MWGKHNEQLHMQLSATLILFLLMFETGSANSGRLATLRDMEYFLTTPSIHQVVRTFFFDSRSRTDGVLLIILHANIPLNPISWVPSSPTSNICTCLHSQQRKIRPQPTSPQPLVPNHQTPSISHMSTKAIPSRYSYHIEAQPLYNQRSTNHQR